MNKDNKTDDYIEAAAEFHNILEYELQKIKDASDKYIMSEKGANNLFPELKPKAPLPFKK